MILRDQLIKDSVRWHLSDLWNFPHILRYKAQRALNPPVFIVGCGHSGTSLLLAVVGSHSRIYAVPYESYFATDMSSKTPQGIRKTWRRFLRFDRAAIRDGKWRWAEKTPRHVHYIGELLEFVPDGKILLIIRDGRDVACSIQDRTGNLQEGIDRWVSDNRAAQPYWTHPRVHTLRYEDLVQSFEPTVTALLAFLGESFEPAMRDFHVIPRYHQADTIEKPPNAFGSNHELYRNWQINQPLFDGSGRWQRLSAEEKNLVKERAGEMLIEYGYASDAGW